MTSCAGLIAVLALAIILLSWMVYDQRERRRMYESAWRAYLTGEHLEQLQQPKSFLHRDQ